MKLIRYACQFCSARFLGVPKKCRLIICQSLVFVAASFAGSDVKSPKTVLLDEIGAASSGNAPAVQASLFTLEKQGDLLLEAVAEAAIAKFNYAHAIADKFGKDAADQLGVSRNSAVAHITSATETIHGDHADVIWKSGSETKQVTLLNVNGQWRIPITAVAPAVEDAGYQIGGRYYNIAKAYSEMADEIRAGQFPTAQAAAQAAADRVGDAAAGRDSQ